MYTSVGKLPVHDEILNKNAHGNFALFSIIKNEISFPPPFYLHTLNLKLHPLTPNYTPNLRLRGAGGGWAQPPPAPLNLKSNPLNLHPLNPNYTPQLPPNPPLPPYLKLHTLSLHFDPVNLKLHPLNLLHLHPLTSNYTPSTSTSTP